MKILEAQYKYLKVLGIGFKHSIEYRADFVLGLLSCFFPIVIQYYLWTAIFTHSGTNSVFGYTYNQMLIYAVLAALITKLVSTDFEGEITNDVRMGGLSKYLVQPISYFFYRIYRFAGEKLLHAIIVFILIMGFLFFYQVNSHITITLSQTLLFVLVIMLALMLKFLISYAVSVISFWIHECNGLFLAINVITVIISGGIFPIDIFGDTAVSISKSLPFYYLTYFPVNVLNGKVGFDDIYAGVVIQLIWIVIFMIFIKWLWRIGMKRYIASGG